eukprot:scaffold4847_cov130-Isochrysis_galbana.AAC.3
MGDPTRYPEIRLSASLVMCTRYSGCRAPFVMMSLFYDNGSTTTCPTSTRSCSRSFNMEMLTFVGHLGPPIRTSTCAAWACAPNGFVP